ncbi:MAG: Asp-tRNA(Asn)/Glu-tRNA(Gln) amidotransferase subunit GatB [Acidobacteriota bacterium]|nr:Asp-tRNA(Asn)/Glu-tRNA(Gln) amidotransferase subunit GatB [Acidobacteriota bacterium]
MATAANDVSTKYEAVIGLEVHVQLLTKTKIFCGCPNHFGSEPNSNVCPVCLGMPGALPVLNQQAVEFAVKASQALNLVVNETSIFARKNYFYPDLPKGYQISQFDKPLAERGWIEVTTAEGALKRIGITRLHMEEDAGKSMHEGFADSDAKTYVDLNRTGTPLAEIVSEPEISTPDEAWQYLTKLREIMLYTEVSDCNMEEGSLRCDANVSLRPRGQKALGTKVEVKNLNSFRFVKQALEYEIERQAEALGEGGTIQQETRLYNPGEGRTYTMRTKERAHDYRYFPEPDLLPLIVTAERQAAIRATLPELPEAKRARLIAEYGLSAGDAATLTATRERADLFETEAKLAKSPKRLANIVLSELQGRLKAAEIELEDSPVTLAGARLAADLVEEGKISSKILKELFDHAFEQKLDFPAIYEKEKPQQITDSAEIEKMIDEVIAASPKQVEQYKAGKTTMIGFFVGQIMKASKGKANPAVVNEILVKKLSE